MNTYLLVHRHPQDYTASADTAAAWRVWFEELGAHVVDLGNPVLSERSALGNCGPDVTLGGYTLISANDLVAAIQLAKGCPTLKQGGGVEVGALSPVPGRQHPARSF